MTRTAPRALFAVLVAVWWLVVPAAPGARAAGPGGTDGTSASDLILPVVLVVGAGAVGAYTYAERRRRIRTRTTPRDGQGWGPPKGPAPPSLDELDGRARRALAATGEAVRAGREELGPASARFGEEAVRPFAEAVDFAGERLAASFRLRRGLDGASPGDDATRRALLEEILRCCAEANERLDSQAGPFDRLRAPGRTAGEAPADARERGSGVDRDGAEPQGGRPEEPRRTRPWQ
ncbi:hypothetical protein [Streptomyces sp. NPDC001744]|uniref:hypothetical protein n=1 Tax=Streptomyces sp. NPDC001744 TaxID=3364606 RepID=UPI003697342D